MNFRINNIYYIINIFNIYINIINIILCFINDQRINIQVVIEP